MIKGLLFLLVCTMFPFACTDTHSNSPASGSETHTTDAEAVQSLLKDIILADNAGNLPSVMAIYADDAILLPPNGPIEKGRTEIEKRYRHIFSTSKLQLENRTVETYVAGDWAYSRGFTIGKASPTDGGAPVKINDKYIMIFRKQLDGTWKIARLMWSKNTNE